MTKNEYLLLTIQVIELITALVATFAWKKYKYSSEKNFIYFFWIIFISDLTGTVLAHTTTINNSVIYNFLMTFYFIFYLRWYYFILEKKRIITILGVLYFVVVLFSIVKESLTKSLLTINFFGGVCIVLFCALFFYMQLLNSNKILSLKTNLPFWITIGNIIMFLGILPLITLNKYINLDSFSYSIVHIVLNAITYTCYILGFKWMKNN